MKGIVKTKWWIVSAWLAAVLLLLFTAPDMGDLVREKGQLKIPDGYPSSEAQQLIEKFNGQEHNGGTNAVALVFYDNDGLTDEDFQLAKKAVQRLEKQKKELGITNIVSHFRHKELEDELVSKDGKAILVSLDVDLQGRTVKELRRDLYEAIAHTKLEHYFTGNLFITEDVILTTEAGVKKTEAITIVFILIVLIAVFRSVVTPVIPLLTVGISYLASLSIVAFLIKYLNFPVSNFTQIFLVVVLFGIGTDYSILLFNRFKEELTVQKTLTDAIAETYRHAGKTVLFSGIAVLFGFAVIGLSQFKIYQSAAAVAVGIAVLLLALFTIVPFFMAVLGEKLFWPAKGGLGHRPNRLWNFAGRFSFARPLVSLVIVAIVTVPFILSRDGARSYNSLDEIGEGYASVKGYDIIEKSFGPGEALPATVVLKNDERMDQSDYLTVMERISQELEKVDGVAKVRSLTRPTGEKLEDLQVARQAETLKDGIHEGNEGIRQIRDGLNEAATKLAGSAPQMAKAKDGVDALIKGTSELQTGIARLEAGLKRIEDGVRQGAIGSGEAKAGLEEIRKNAEKMLVGYDQLVNGYTEAQRKLAVLHANYKKIESALKGINAQYIQVEQAISFLENYIKQTEGPQKTAALQSLEGIKTYSYTLRTGFFELYGNLTQLNEGLGQAVRGLDAANHTFAEVNRGQEQLIAGMQKLIIGIGRLEAGLDAAAAGQNAIIQKLPEMESGLGAMSNGQKRLLAGFAGMDDQIGQLSQGLDQSVDGLTRVYDGFTKAENYLSGLAARDEESGIFVPEEMLEKDEYKTVLDTYLSPDRKIAKIDVIFDQNPYATEAISRVDDIRTAVERAVKNTKLENADVAVGGVTSVYHDLGAMTQKDFSRTVAFMLIGIGIVLIVLFRSLIMPIYIVASLLLTYFSTMGITEWIFTDLLGYEGINWAVPFFGFVILMALGVDYSIFLMGRFNEYRGEPVDKAMILSMGKMGTVIVSAVIILGGTFAAMLPSGVLTLMQIATITICGLVLYSLVMLPLFVPVMVKLFGKANWWPFLPSG